MVYQNMPVVHGYLLFLVGSCVEMLARNMHQYSAAKPKRMEEAAMWLEKCEATLSEATSLLTECGGVRNIVYESQISSQENDTFLEMNDSPLVSLVQRRGN